MNETHGTLEGIYITATAAALPQPVARVGAIAGKGLEGDRYALGCGTFSKNAAQRDVTLIEAEEVERFVRETGHPLDAAQSRRNLLTRGIRLNDLVGREFSVGGIRMLGLRLCEPCTHLARITGMPVLPDLVHRGGLYAQILEDGELSVGDAIVVSGELRASENQS